METFPSPSTALTLLAVKIRSGREVANVTTDIEHVQAGISVLCKQLGVDHPTAMRISDGVRASLARVTSLQAGETLSFCDCDAQFSGNCRRPDMVKDNPCNVDTPFLQRSASGDAVYFFPAGALQGAGGTRTPGSALKLCGQRVEISVATPAEQTESLPVVDLPESAEMQPWRVPV